MPLYVLLLLGASLAPIRTVDVKITSIPPSCVAGKYRKDGLSCQLCPIGFYCPGGTDEFPIQCRPGKISLICDVGNNCSYYGAESESQCVDCPLGFKCTKLNSGIQEYKVEVCAQGEYSRAGEETCTQCPVGAYCLPYQDVQPCGPGYDCSVVGRHYKPLCPAGKYCKDGKTITDCADGYYSAEGATKCTICPQGRICQNKDHPPVACPAGSYNPFFGIFASPLLGVTSCKPCDAGKSCPNDDGNSPTITPAICERGKFSEASYAECLNCPAGIKCTAQNAKPTAGNVCPAGEFSRDGDADCFICPPGYECQFGKTLRQCPSGFYSLAGETHCQRCPTNHECLNPMMKPVPCRPGWYRVNDYTSTNPNSPNTSSGVIMTRCAACPVGWKCPGTDIYPAKCSPGTSSKAAATICSSPCPAGFSCDGSTFKQCSPGQIPNAYQTECVDCPAGHACPGKLWTMIEACPPGFTSPAGQEYCLVAPAGTYAPTTKATVTVSNGSFADTAWNYQIKCPPGYDCFDDKIGRTRVACPPGTYQKITDAATGSTVCTECEKGKFCPPSMEGLRPAGGITCPSGYYADQTGMSECIECPPGKQCTNQHEGNLEDCPTGYVQLGANWACEKCPAMHECNKGETIVACPAFHYSDEGQGDCEPCRDGMSCVIGYSKSDQKHQATQCPDGYYASALDYYCQRCPRGHKCPKNSSAPVKCEAGTYAYEQKPTCTNCPKGYFSFDGAEYCLPVPGGWKAIYASSDTTKQLPLGIEICESGSYSEWGENICNPCEDGYLCPAGSQEPANWAYSCPRGSYCVGGVQTKCLAGKHGTMERGTSEAVACATCPPGYNCQEGAEHFELYPCPRGYYCENGQAVSCGGGFYTVNLYTRSKDNCLPCQPGVFCPSGGYNMGTVCPEEYICPFESEPVMCPAGTYGGYKTGKTDLSECIVCPPGHYCVEGSKEPTPAPEGYYTPFTGVPSSKALLLCPGGYFCPSTGNYQFKGNKCPPGYFCIPGSSTGTASTQRCPEGTYSDYPGLASSSQCLPCPAGKTCYLATTSDSTTLMGACPDNHYCPPGTAKTKERKCPAGTSRQFKDGANTKTYSAANSLANCLRCPAGYYCAEGAAAVACPDHHYCPVGTRYQNQFPCPAGTYYTVGTNEPGATHKFACKPCNKGQFCPNQMAYEYETGINIGVNDVPDGYYSDMETGRAQKATKCPAGHWCKKTTKDYSTYIPQPCAAGKYSDEGAATCSDCLAGYYCPNEGTSKEQMLTQICPRGYICKHQANTALATRAYSNTGLQVWPNTQHYGCPKNKYCPEGTGRTSELDLPEGTIYPHEGLYDIKDTRLGYSMAGTFNNAAGTCDKHHFCYKGAMEQFKCGPGYFRHDTGGMAQDNCGRCPAGFTCPLGLTDPVDCTAGHFCPEGSAVPQPCPPGTYSTATNVADSRACIKCPANHYCPFFGMDKSPEFAAGTPFALTYASVFLGQYRDFFCDSGYVCLEGASRPDPDDGITGYKCPQGKHCATGTVNAYLATPIASVVPTQTDCAAGTYTENTGAMSVDMCTPCMKGYYCPAGEKIICPAGHYCDRESLTQLGTDATSATGKTNVVQAGHYSPEGSIIAYECEVGYYQTVTGKGSCDECPAGSYCAAVGMTAITTATCTEGYYCPEYSYYKTRSLVYRELPCPIGTYMDKSGGGSTSIDDCLVCMAGQACAMQGMKKADANAATLKCKKGFFCLQGAKTINPIEHKPGYYGPCQPGSWCGTDGGTATLCVAGKFNPSERGWSVNFCMDCPPGYACTKTGLSMPDAICESGYYCEGGSDSSQKAACNTSGSYCPEGSFTEKVCPIGYRTPGDGSGTDTAKPYSHCIICDSGKFCIYGLQIDCPAGFYCP